MKPSEVLAFHNLKRTACREGIIKAIAGAGSALSEDEIRTNLEGHFDRTTFYRSFKTLEEKKIIHKIVVDSLVVKYALDNSITHKTEHAHFYCKQCEAVQCLDNIAIQTPVLPQGYAFSEAEFIIKGFCINCEKTSVEA